MSEEFKLEGLADLEKALMEMAAPVAKSIGKRALMSAVEPFVDTASELAPVREGYLETHIEVGDRLSRRQKTLSPKESEVEIYAGPDSSAAQEGVQQEFGNENHGAQPFMRPAWDETRMDVMFNVQTDLAAEIDKRAQRAAARQAKLIAQAQAGK